MSEMGRVPVKRSLWRRAVDYFTGADRLQEAQDAEAAAHDAAKRLGVNFADAVHTHTQIHFDILDRLRLLVRGEVTVHLTTLTERSPGFVMTKDAVIQVRPFMRGRRPPDLGSGP